MEFLLFIGLIGLIWVAKHSGVKSRHPKPNRTQRTTISPTQSLQDSKPFEAGTAKCAPIDTVLEGPAYVVDGDTIVIAKVQVRLFGIDAPEIDHPYGKKAKWALYSLCKGLHVRAEVAELDSYGRAVARCYLPDGRDLSKEMVIIGMAIDWAKFSGGVYRHLETPDARKKLWLADARQKGRMHVWEQFETQQKIRASQNYE
ncbi:thermonuclease family protein [Celeribacter marinus]|uniref:thermonuclease family protein n=1 Tax=Celeribacter marinus TaxID=1397108 RepID=UPI00317F1E9D